MQTFITVSTGFLFLFAFAGTYGFLRHFLPWRQRPYALLFSYPVFFLLNTVLHYISCIVHPAAFIGFVLASLGFYWVPRTHKWLFFVFIPIVFIIYCVPIADTDSIGYVLPMADMSIVYSTPGVWDTLNERSLCRFWGSTAQIANIIRNSSGSVALADLPSLLGLVFCGIISYYCLRNWYPKFSQRYGILLFLGTPMAMASLFTAKDDWIFAGTSLFAFYLIQRRQLPQQWILLVGFLCLILSKLFFPITIIAIFGYLLFYARKRIIHIGIIFLGIWLFAVVLHFPRIVRVMQLFPNQPKAWIAASCGAAPYEVSVNSVVVKKEVNVNTPLVPEVRIPLWRQIFQNERVLWQQVRSGNFGVLLLYNYASFSIFWVIIFAGVLVGLCNGSHRRPILFVILWVITFFSIFHNPNSGNIRYMLMPALVALIYWTVWLSRYNIINIMVMGLFWCTAMLSPAVHDSVRFVLQVGRPPAPLETVPLNPVLIPYARTFKLAPVRDGLSIYIPQSPGFGFMHLFGDRTVLDMLETSMNPAVLINIPSGTTVFSGVDWQTGVNPPDLSLLDAYFSTYLIFPIEQPYCYGRSMRIYKKN